MVLITVVTGAYKPTYNWGASHCMSRLRYLFGHVTSQQRQPDISESSPGQVTWNEGGSLSR